MTTALVTTDTDDLIQRVAEGRFTPTESAMLHRLVKLRPSQKPPSRDELALVVSEAMHLGLDPFAGQCYFINFGDTWQTYAHWSGLLKIAEDTGEYEGHDGPFYSDDGRTWTDAWVPDTPPRFARVVVYRHGHRPKVAVAKWVRSNKGTPNWRTDPEGMLGKVALRLGVRMAFPTHTARLSVVPEGDDSDDQALRDEPMTTDQRKAIFAQLNDLDITDRSRRLMWASNVLEREVTTFTGLTSTDAVALLDWLAQPVENADQAGGVDESIVTGKIGTGSAFSPGHEEVHRKVDPDHVPSTVDPERGAGGTTPPFVPVHRQPSTTSSTSATMQLASAVPQESWAVDGDWQRADPAGPGKPSTASGSLAEGATVISDNGDSDRQTELIFKIAAAHSEWARTMPKAAAAWFAGFLAHVKRPSLNECDIEELEAGWDWLVALNRAK